ncbi:MAG TPA: hypothetical protein H9895_09185 [Candidatus Pseudogracilibacillus intestinigallinarum]|uniref:Uncharacterized protein n=1 Tax=Candidatus Pseudogracilibacillus intestinigallinarum TaxID=2838742 RepID=A0A9D1TLC0_9BACI|nr:hypothetical protein [Candidatus Pseudogracilibacillus intestinigallinarum]
MIHEITLMEAYLIEALKSSDASHSEIISYVRQRKADQMQRVAQSNSDFTLLYELEGQLEDILRDGYRVKFLTFPGLQRLLLLQVEKEADLDYTLNGFTVEGLSLTTEEAEKVETFLSKNWTFTKTGETYTIQPTR